jgi:hypothetical protein
VVGSDHYQHWFVIPVLFCGILITIDAVNWFRGRVDSFDPVGVLGLLGFHFFFLAPLLHVLWDQWLPPYITPPSDWREWLGWMGVLNALGLIFYCVTRNVVLKYEPAPSTKVFWYINRRRFFIIVSFALLIMGCVQIWFYTRYGGILKYIGLVEERAVIDAFQGMGWAFMISDSFPILVLMAFAVIGEKEKLSRLRIVFVVFLVTFFVLRIIFGGLAGSRGNMIWGLFWAAGIVHFWIRPISRKIILLGCVFLILFMYFYGFYKAVGVDVSRAFESKESHAEMAEETGRTVKYLLLNDLGRSEIQAFVLYRLSGTESEYEYAGGRTYLGTLALFIHRSIWPDRPPTKLKEGTDILYGTGTYLSGRQTTSAVFGLSGEAMLNFGPLAVPFVFLIFGFAIGYVRRLMFSLDSADSRLLILPFLISLCLVMLVADSDNVMFFLVKNAAIPFAILALSSTRLVTTRHRHQN